MPLDGERCHGPAGCGICTELHWLLQRCTSCTTTVNHRAITTCAECSCPTYFWSAVSRPHHSGPGAVTFRIKFKLCRLMHQIHVGRCPAYLAELVSLSVENCRQPGLHSTSSSVYLKPRLHTKFAERDFSFSGPAEWNCLLSDLWMITDTTIFKKKLKAYYYKEAFFVL